MGATTFGRPTPYGERVPQTAILHLRFAWLKRTGEDLPPMAAINAIRAVGLSAAMDLIENAATPSVQGFAESVRAIGLRNFRRPA